MGSNNSQKVPANTNFVSKVQVLWYMLQWLPNLEFTFIKTCLLAGNMPVSTTIFTLEAGIRMVACRRQKAANVSEYRT